MGGENRRKGRKLIKVVTLGEILVEIMAQDKGEGFRQPVRLIGPFPSGAPAIFIDQVAKLGQPCAIIASVGDDDFGWLNVKRLADDGVDTSAVEVHPDEVTGSAFVRYRENGERDFLFNIKNSAAGQVRFTDNASRVLGSCGHLHVSGSSLLSPRIVELMSSAIARVKSGGGTVSFDPNVRSDVASQPAMRAILRDILRSCDIFLPSGPEVTLLTDATSPEAAIPEIIAMGVSSVVVKRGAEGATYHGAEGRVDMPAFKVTEVDPTGAGDCFAATFVTCRLQGRSVEESLAYANAAGAIAVGTKGPMEATSDFAQLDQLRSGVRRGTGRKLTALISSAGLGPRPAPEGITSVCSGHPLVVEAALAQGAADDATVLIEATSNQVNHQGGYTGLTPAAFRDEVHRIAGKVGFPRERIILGGDHLGPSPWRHLPADEALHEAATMVAAYVAAGYEKIHIDTSMGCRDEPDHLGDRLTAQRAAQLAAVAEEAAGRTGTAPHYVVGTEVPTPGGARHEIKQLEVTPPEAVRATLEAHRQAFDAAGAGGAFQRVMAVVAQPGVEFDDRNVVVYEPDRARALTGALAGLPGLVFEAHSTDYQPAESLAALVRDGFAVLKVGPGLTFAMREALYGLDNIATAMSPAWREHSLIAAMEAEMLAKPGYWSAYYQGEPDYQRALRHFSYSDRIRYYWASPGAQVAVERLFSHFDGTEIPAFLISQFLPTLYPRVASGALKPVARSLVLEAVRDVLRVYAAACRVK